jgi:hypothetical protein
MLHPGILILSRRMDFVIPKLLSGSNGETHRSSTQKNLTLPQLTDKQYFSANTENNNLGVLPPETASVNDNPDFPALLILPASSSAKASASSEGVVNILNNASKLVLLLN